MPPTDHPGEALVVESLSRELTRAENAVIYAYTQELKAHAAEASRLSDQLIGENPMAGLIAANTAALRASTQATAVTNHATVPAGLHFAAAVKEEAAALALERTQQAQNELALLDLQKVVATTPSTWTAAKIGAVGTLIVGVLGALAGGVAAILQALAGAPGAGPPLIGP